MKDIEYKYKEDEILLQVADYINGTYSQHYAMDKIEASEFIMDAGHGEGFFIGNILKYAQRYGKKGSYTDARKDLMKVIHYAMMAVYNHDESTDWKDPQSNDVGDIFSDPKRDNRELVYGKKYTLVDDYDILPRDRAEALALDTAVKLDPLAYAQQYSRKVFGENRMDYEEDYPNY